MSEQENVGRVHKAQPCPRMTYLRMTKEGLEGQAFKSPKEAPYLNKTRKRIKEAGRLPSYSHQVFGETLRRDWEKHGVIPGGALSKPTAHKYQ